jgi:predicted glycoside hydrolase/deacetylase ChbG (UPF0249 family)
MIKMKLMPLITCCFFFSVVSDCIAQQEPARLIIRGDDMGYSHSGNEALIKAYKNGIETSIEIIVPSPWFPEAAKFLQENPGVDVGIHLAITSEWDNVKWRPLTNCPSLKDQDGYFFPMSWPNPNYPGLAIQENNYDINDIEKEFRAQIELAIKKIPRISHISGHMGCTNLDDAVKKLTLRLAEEYKINIDPGTLGIKGVGYAGPHKTLDEKKKSFIAMLNSLQPGIAYLFVDHPGLDTPELRAIHHIGYEDVAEDRQGVTSLWTDPEIREVLKQKKIILVSYKDMKPR